MNKSVIARGVSIVTPVYRSSGTLAEFVRRVNLSMADHLEEWELILVDDHSPDATWAELVRLAKISPRIRVFRLGANVGQHAATLAGIGKSQFDVTITMDDDLQHRPEDIHRLVAEIRAGNDVVYAVSKIEEHVPWRNLTSRLGKITLARLAGQDNMMHMSAFRAFRTSFRSSWTSVSGSYVSIDVLLSWASSEIHHVVVEMDQREQGNSGYTISKLIRHFLNMTTGYSVRPLRFVSYIGISFSVLGAGILAYVVLNWWFIGGALPGFTFTASIILTLGGLQLLSLGIIGEYLGQVHTRTMGRPPFHIADSVNE